MRIGWLREYLAGEKSEMIGMEPRECDGRVGKEMKQSGSLEVARHFLKHLSEAFKHQSLVSMVSYTT